jgi:recombination DNA repair RAD52 pathway protein
MSKFQYQEILKNLRTFSEREDLDSNQKRILHNNLEKLDSYSNRMEKVDLMDTLTKPFPMELRKTRKGYEGKTLTYIETVYYIERLNQAFSYQWDFQVLQETITDIEVIVKGRLTVEIDGRTVIKEQYGQSEITYITIYDKVTRQAIGKKPLTGDACKSAG